MVVKMDIVLVSPNEIRVRWAISPGVWGAIEEGGPASSGAWWSLWVPSSLGYSMILWLYRLYRQMLAMCLCSKRLQNFIFFYQCFCNRNINRQGAVEESAFCRRLPWCQFCGSHFGHRAPSKGKMGTSTPVPSPPPQESTAVPCVVLGFLISAQILLSAQISKDKIKDMCPLSPIISWLQISSS